MFGKRPGAGDTELRPSRSLRRRRRLRHKCCADRRHRRLRKPRGRAEPPPPPIAVDNRSDQYYEIKTTIFNALIDTIDLAQLAQLDAESAREEIRDIVNEIISIKNVVMSIAEQEQLLGDICNDVLGYGPLEPLLARDDIADIMVNGAERVFIEVSGKVQLTNIRFRDNAQLMNICQRIVSQIGRRVDESSPICDARLPDGSRVNVIAPPLAIDGPTLTIRKFKKDKLKMADLDPLRLDLAGRRQGARRDRQLPLQCFDLRRYRFGQDDAAQHDDGVHRPRRARDHLRRRGRASIAAAACRAPGNAPAEPGRVGRNHDARSGQELSAYAPRTHHRGRGPRTRGVRLVAGDEHGSRRFDGHAARQHAARSPAAYRIHDHDGRLQSAVEDHSRNGRWRDRRHRAGGASCATVRGASRTSPK